MTTPEPIPDALPPALEQRLQQCWDERRDPLDDAGLCAWLSDHPEALPGFAQRRALVAALATMPVPTRRRRVAGSALVLAAGLAGLCLFLAWPAPVSARPAGRVLAATVEFTPPRALASVTWRERTVLCATPDVRIEITDQRSQRR